MIYCQYLFLLTAFQRTIYLSDSLGKIFYAKATDVQPEKGWREKSVTTIWMIHTKKNFELSSGHNELHLFRWIKKNASMFYFLNLWKLRINLKEFDNGFVSILPFFYLWRKETFTTFPSKLLFRRKYLRLIC